MSTETSAKPLTWFERRERTGSQKRAVGIRNIARMLPKSDNYKHGGNPPPGRFAPDLGAMGMEDSYCDIWDKTDIVDARMRSIFNVSLMTGVGNVSNPFELALHAPGAFYNGVTVTELEQIVTHARAYVGSPASAWAKTSIEKALREHGIVEGACAPGDLERREKTGSQKRTIAREVLRQIEPGSELLNIKDEIPSDKFGAELDLMILENCYFDLWGRADVFDRKTRSVITLGLLMGIPNHEALRQHVPVALRNGVAVPELEDLLYQAATYLGYPQGLAIRETLAQGLKDAGVK